MGQAGASSFMDGAVPKTLSQWTGLTVVSFIVLGRDTNLFYALPLALFAGSFAALLESLANGRLALAQIRLRR